MLYARDVDERFVEPSPGGHAYCPACRGDVNAKCGPIVEWHWAHDSRINGGDCDAWAENETPWHRWWKERAPETNREVVIERGGVVHRADLRRPGDDYVIELQHSSICSDDIRAREAFYGRMVWVLDARLYTFPLSEFDCLVDRLEQVDSNTWRWRRPRRSFSRSERTIFLDLGMELLEVPRGGVHVSSEPSSDRRHCVQNVYLTGRLIDRDDFLSRARLRKLSGCERDTVLSFIVEWRGESEGLLRIGHTEVPRPPPLRRSELRSAIALESWLSRKDRDVIDIYAWHGDGRVLSLKGSAAGRRLAGPLALAYAHGSHAPVRTSVVPTRENALASCG